MAETKSSRSRLTEITIRAASPKAARYDIRDDQIVGLVLRVAPTGRKTWSLSYRNREGRQQRFTLGLWPNVKLARARQLATEKFGEIAGGHDVQAERQQDRQTKAVPTLKAFVSGEYGSWVKASHKSSVATLRRLRHTLPWQDKPLDQITLKEVERWQTARLNDGLAHETVKRDIATVRSLMSKAVEWEILKSNPLAALRTPKGPENTVVRYLGTDEEERLLGALTAAPAHLKPIVILAMNTGMRQGELLKLDWSSIDLDAKRLTVTSKTAKSSNVRHVPLNKKAHAALEDWRKQGAGTGLVFGLTNIRKSWGTLLRQAAIKNFRFHDLRHHFASKLVMAGVDLNTIRELLGHADIRMTLRYAHLAPEHKAAAVELL